MRTNGSLGQGFPTEICHDKIPIRLAFALALYTGFLTRLSQPLGAIDTFSTAFRPRQTVHLLVFLLAEVSGVNFEEKCYIVEYTETGVPALTSPSYSIHQSSRHSNRLQ